MAKRISYDDNLFFIGEKVRILTDCLDLDIDATIFLDKIVDEILFIENALSSIYQSLMENDLLLERPDHLHSLMRAKGRFAHLLESLARADLTFSAHVVPFEGKFKASAASQREDIDDIRTMLTESDETGTSDSALVSEEEFKFLLMEEESSDEGS